MGITHMSEMNDINRDTEKLANQFFNDFRYSAHDFLPAILGRIISAMGLGNTITDDWLSRIKEADVVDTAAQQVVDLIHRHPPFTDVLGPLYMAMASKWKSQAMGQYFTPQSISDMMAMMQIGNVSLDKPEELTRIGEPACGSGVMLLSVAKHIVQSFGKEALLKVHLVANDLDPLCSAMTVTQLIANWQMHDCPIGRISVFQGNALAHTNFWDKDHFRCWLDASPREPAPSQVAAKNARYPRDDEPGQLELAL